MGRRFAILIPTTLPWLILPAPLAAQDGYFGQNNVQYEAFDFKVLKTTHFDIYFYAEEEDAARMAARMVRRRLTHKSILT